jgi:hypothetical protein
VSIRGLDFIRKWAAINIDVRLTYRGREQRVQVLAATCRMDARAASIGIDEMEDEVGDLEIAFAGFIDGRPTLL